MKNSQPRSVSSYARSGAQSHLAPICKIFAALSHPVRLQIVRRLCQQPCTVNALSRELGVAQPTISQNLAVLNQVGLVVAEAQGTQRLYRLRGPRIALMLTLLEEFCRVHELSEDASFTPEQLQETPVQPYVATR
ncbi:ArsR/SmtB family transcription factor [Chthonomonas calidirosea]|uniref:ArsR/SmtB family transcription factor n=1 Tax=Chthonomonas calidirosea TaxID=454171 RepID=UPI0006EC8218|nr:metalloregulator ArsR/SmtB family transcription factor [Chthonomonas calidirosea]CEK15789.1 transcriptional regulator, ArsR family [Chthonomonas calidirosea]